MNPDEIEAWMRETGVCRIYRMPNEMGFSVWIPGWDNLGTGATLTEAFEDAKAVAHV